MARQPGKAPRRRRDAVVEEMTEQTDDGIVEEEATETATAAPAREWNTGAGGTYTGRRRTRGRDRAMKLPPPSPDLVSVLDALVGRGAEKLELSRYNELNGVAYYVCEVSVSLFSLQWVKQFLGGGRFRLAAWGTAQDGRKGLVMPPVDFAIEGVAKSFTDPTTGQTIGTPAPGTVGVVDANALQQTALATLVTTMTTSMAAMSKMMMGLAEVSGAKKGGDDLDRLLVLKQILDDGREKGRSMADNIAMYREFREAASEFAPKDTGNPLLDALKEGVSGAKPMFAAIARKIDGAPATAAPPRLTSATPAAAATADAPAPAAEVQDVANIDDYLAQLVGYLLDKARRGVAPERVAVRVIEEIEEDHPLWYAGMKQQAERNPQFVESLLTRLRAHPDMAQADELTIEWTRQVLTIAAEELTRPADEEGDEDEEEEGIEEPNDEVAK